MERPVPGTLEIEAAAGTPEAASLQDFIDYGTPTDVNIQVPGWMAVLS
jgi:hypothetical protein